MGAGRVSPLCFALAQGNVRTEFRAISSYPPRGVRGWGEPKHWYSVPHNAYLPPHSVHRGLHSRVVRFKLRSHAYGAAGTSHVQPAMSVRQARGPVHVLDVARANGTVAPSQPREPSQTAPHKHCLHMCEGVEGGSGRCGGRLREHTPTKNTKAHAPRRQQQDGGHLIPKKEPRHRDHTGRPSPPSHQCRCGSFTEPPPEAPPLPPDLPPALPADAPLTDRAT